MSLLLQGAGSPGKFIGTVFFDNFSTDRLAAEYTVSNPASWTVAAGIITATNPGFPTSAVPTVALSMGDARVTQKGTATGTRRAMALCHLGGPTNTLYAQYNGAALIIAKNDAGSATTLATGPGISPAATDYTRAFRVGSVLTIEHWTTDPSLGGSPTNTLSYTLTGADATKFGAGVSGGAGLYHFNNTYSSDELRVEAL